MQPVLRVRAPGGSPDGEAERPSWGGYRGTPEAVGREEEPLKAHLSGAVVHI